MAFAKNRARKWHYSSGKIQLYPTVRLAKPLCGCLVVQFIRRLRLRYLRLHRAIGYLYGTSIGLSGMAGLIVAPFAMGGLISSVGFSLLAIVWLVATSISILAARKGDLPTHRRWSYFSYALTFAAITQRTLLLVPLLTDVPFLPIYQLSAWLPWLLNLGIAQMLYHSSGQPMQSTPKLG